MKVAWYNSVLTIDEINEIRQQALDSDDYKTALSCTLSKAKLLGGGRAIEYREKERNSPLYGLVDL